VFGAVKGKQFLGERCERSIFPLSKVARARSDLIKSLKIQICPRPDPGCPPLFGGYRVSELFWDAELSHFSPFKGRVDAF